MAATQVPPSTIPSVPSQTLQARLKTLAKVRQNHILLRSLVCGLLPAVAICAVGVGLYKLHILPDAPFWLPILPLGSGVLWALRSARIQARGDFVAALEADARLGENDRLASALAFINSQESARYTAPHKADTWIQKAGRAVFGAPVPAVCSVASPVTDFVPALVEDAARRAQKLDPRRVYPLRFDRRAQTLAGLTLVLAGLCCMPDYPILLSPKEKTERTTVIKEGQKLVAFSQAFGKKAAALPAVDQLNRRLEKLGHEMARGRMTKRAALTDIGELRKQLQKAQTSQGQSQTQNGDLPQILQVVEQAPLQSKTGREVQRDLMSGQSEQAAKSLEKVADKVEKRQLSAKESEETAKDLEQVAQALKERGGQANERAAKQLEAAATALRQENQQRQQGQSSQNQRQSGAQSSGGQRNSDNRAASVLRDMANGLRQNQSGDESGKMREMLDKLRAIENGTNSARRQPGTLPPSQKQSGTDGQNEQSGENRQGITTEKVLPPTSGQGNNRGGAGLGPRDLSTGNKGGGVSNQKSARSGDKRRYEDVWSDRIPKTRDKIDKINGKPGVTGKAEQMPIQGEGDGGRAMTPYYDVYESYQRDAEDAISREAVPPAYKESVKNYFESIKP